MQGIKVYSLLLLFVISLCNACEKWDKNVALYCKFGKESSPCLQQNVQEEKKKCCSRGCSFVEFKKDKACCFTEECLRRCYPGKDYTMGQVY